MEPNEPTNDPNVTINRAQRLYVMKHTSGYTCLGFDVAYRRAARYAAWAESAAPDANAIGTPGGWDDYSRALAAVSEKVRTTGQRCPCDLEPRLIGLEGKRVEVTTTDGERRRFWVGKSTGHLPIHLEVKTRRSYGGVGVLLDDTDDVRVVDRGPR